MSLFCRQACGRLAFLAILAGIVLSLVACEAGPGTSAQPDPVKIKAVTFEKVGTAREIPLGDKFSGEELTYTATSSNKAVATVEVDNDEDILTVTAVGAGEATITVTAADSQDRTASQTFKVTVKATTSEPEPGAPTVRTGAPGSFDVDQGDTQTVTLSRVFTGEDLEFTVASNDTDVATASEDAGILIISARSPGEATITVTATNDDGNAEHEITVNVPTPVTTTPEPPTTSATLTIKLDESAKRTLSAKQTLQAPAGGGVRVEPSLDGETGNVWLITALKKGTHTIAIFSGGATPEKVGSIVVEVPNSPPVRKHDEEHRTLNTDDLANTSGLYNTVAASLNLYDFFDDPDEDRLRFRVGSKPSWVLIDSTDGFVKTTDDADTTDVEATDLTFEVLETPTAVEFKVSIYAVDDSGSVSLRPVVLTFPTTNMIPRIRSYSVQQGSKGELGTLKVGPRLGVPHEVTFTRSDGTTGFQFANKFIEKWSDYLDDSVAAGTVTSEPDAPIVGSSFFAIKATDGIVAEWISSTSGLDGDPEVTLQLEKARSGSITIEYTVWVASKKKVDNTIPDGAIPVKKSTSKRLSVTVVTCSSPPDPLSDCYPGVDP
jgi:hypothetical protein